MRYDYWIDPIFESDTTADDLKKTKQTALDLPSDDPYLGAVRMHSQLESKRWMLEKLLKDNSELKDTCNDTRPYLEAAPWKEPASLKQIKADICMDPRMPAVTAVKNPPSFVKPSTQPVVTAVKDPPSFVKSPRQPAVSTVKVKQLQEAETKPVKHGFWTRLLELFRGTKPEGDYKKL